MGKKKQGNAAIDAATGNAKQKQEQIRHIKSYEELSFTDDFIFCKVLTSDKSLCIELLELILGIRIVDIRYFNQQQEMKETYDSKGIRLDVYAENEDEVYNMEMQVKLAKELPKRSRYYQDVMDLNLLKSGGSYADLKKSYVIFICLEDVFSDVFTGGFPVYTFENLCLQAPELHLNDGTQKIFLNASAAEGEHGNGMPPKLRTFLQYLRKKIPKDDFTKRLDDCVQKAKNNEEWRVEYMTLEMKFQDIRDEARAEGEMRKLISQVIKKYSAGKDLEQIADEVEEKAEVILPITDIIRLHPEYDEDEVYDSLT